MTASQAGTRAGSRTDSHRPHLTTPSAVCAARSRIRHVRPPPCQDPRSRTDWRRTASYHVVLVRHGGGARGLQVELEAGWGGVDLGVEQGGGRVDPRLGAPPAGSCAGSAVGRRERSWYRWGERRRRPPWLSDIHYFYILPDIWILLIRNFKKGANCKKTCPVDLTCRTCDWFLLKFGY
jgi:hypothetical protein